MTVEEALKNMVDRLLQTALVIDKIVDVQCTQQKHIEMLYDSICSLKEVIESRREGRLLHMVDYQHEKGGEE
jgi:hypothetical protein